MFFAVRSNWPPDVTGRQRMSRLVRVFRELTAEQVAS